MHENFPAKGRSKRTYVTAQSSRYQKIQLQWMWKGMEIEISIGNPQTNAWRKNSQNVSLPPLQQKVRNFVSFTPLKSSVYIFSFVFIRFATEKLQKSHIFRIHEADKEAKTEICEYCAKTFTTRKEVLAHIRGMHTENSIRRERAQCQICKAWLSNRYTLKEHLIRHNSEPQKCNQCDKISPNQHALRKFNEV